MALLLYRELKPSMPRLKSDWPEGRIVGEDGTPQEQHRGQELTWGSEASTVAMLAGSQGGKTIFGPVWLEREINRQGPGDYFAVSPTYDLFKLKLLPALREYFESALGIGRYWAGDRILEVADPETGAFWATRSDDPMYARIILRSANALGGLESGTGKAAWLDEAGQPEFLLMAWRAINRRLALARGRKLITSTLYDIGWLDTEILDVAEKGGETTVEEADSGGVIEFTHNADADLDVVQFDSIINPAFPDEEFERARATMPDDEFQAFYRGRRVAMRTLIYDCFDKRTGTCPRFVIPKGWRRMWGMDFGDTNMAAIKYAIDPSTVTWYGYAVYKAGKRSIEQHARQMMAGDGRPNVVWAGSKSEGQWRREFRKQGLPIKDPTITDVAVGIARVYSAHKQGRLIYFDDLDEVIDEKRRYRHKRDRFGNITSEIENKNSFHLMDCERYAISEGMKGLGLTAKDIEEMGQIEDYESPWR